MASDEQRIDRIRTLFSEAQLRPEGTVREAYLTTACDGNESMREEVLSLLNAAENSEEFLSRDASGSAFFEVIDLSGTQIGNYRLTQLIGEGGFGEIYRAEQTEPFQREVALKIIKPGMDTQGIVSRFMMERQTLAQMNHPNIAQVYDAGTTDIGRPYFVMELVCGTPLLAYCDNRQLTVRERIGLFRQVCAGVQHAHKKGILHGDLKPSNILVYEEDGKATPKIIDFGVARSLRNPAPATREIRIGTPLYMSPEQLDGNPARVDVRSDLYSLGIILYELVTGITPMEHKTPSALSLPELRESLHRDNRPRPSRRYWAMGRKRAVIAGRRSCGPWILKQKLKGDMDRIVMKAIEIEPHHRYDDAVSLDEDLARYLNNQPVAAGKPRIPRRIKKYTRRHKPGCFAVFSFLITLAIGICIMTYSYLHLPRTAGSLIGRRGWTLEKFYDMGGLRSNGFCIRPDGSVLIVNEWGSKPKGLYWAKKGGAFCEADAFSVGPEFVDPEDAVELPEGIYVTVNRKYPDSGTILRVARAGGAPEIFIDRSAIINPYTLLLVPPGFSGRNVRPGDLLVFDNAHGIPRKTAIWAVNRQTKSVKPLVINNPLNKGFLSGGFSPNGMLYAGLNTHESDEVSILKITPEGRVRVVFNSFYAIEHEADKINEHPKAVHPVTGEMFFGAENRIYAFYPEQTSPTLVISKPATTLRWAPDGRCLYFIADQAVWTLTGPGIESEPVSRD